jgi:hypothetical protein
MENRKCFASAENRTSSHPVRGLIAIPGPAYCNSFTADHNEDGSGLTAGTNSILDHTWPDTPPTAAFMTGLFAVTEMCLHIGHVFPRWKDGQEVWELQSEIPTLKRDTNTESFQIWIINSNTASGSIFHSILVYCPRNKSSLAVWHLFPYWKKLYEVIWRLSEPSESKIEPRISALARSSSKHDSAHVHVLEPRCNKRGAHTENTTRPLVEEETPLLHTYKSRREQKYWS